jgi:hypothetical protein
MKHIVIISFIFIICNPYAWSQGFNEEKSFHDLQKLRFKVVKAGIVGKKYYRDYTKNKKCNKTCITYLGQIKTSQNKIYKILTCFYVHGASCRGSSRIVIYDIDNKYVGNYALTMPDDLPNKIIDNKLIFTEANTGCKFRKGFQISFDEGLPANIWLPCDEAGLGDSYPFSVEE